MFAKDTLVWKGRCKKAESWSKDFWIGSKVLKKKLDVSWDRLDGKDQFKSFVEKAGPKGCDKAETVGKTRSAIEKHVRMNYSRLRTFDLHWFGFQFLLLIEIFDYYCATAGSGKCTTMS